jgi:hypothetical protein
VVEDVGCEPVAEPVAQPGVDQRGGADAYAVVLDQRPGGRGGAGGGPRTKGGVRFSSSEMSRRTPPGRRAASWARVSISDSEFPGDLGLDYASEEWSIIAHHRAMGVDAYVADVDEIPIDMNQLFMVEGDHRFAWRADISLETKITRVVCTSNLATVRKYHDIWMQLVRLGIAKRLTSS